MSAKRKKKRFAVQMLTEELAEMFAKLRHLEGAIRQRLGASGYEF